MDLSMTLTKEDAVYCAGIFENYFAKFNRIDEYMRDQKIASLNKLEISGLFPPEDELFSEFDMHPNDMEFEIFEPPNKTWETLVGITSSHINIAPVGRNIRLAVKEKNTDKYIGFIRLGSPVINCKPRNEMLGQVFTQNEKSSKSFNKCSMMGFVIVPAQPFGFNYLGGKLLAAIITSHKVREIVNKKYDMNLCLFETTSLYGSSKTVSQYDGMKPYLRYKGLTDSDFLPLMHGKTYHNLKNFVETRIGGNIVPENSSSQKLKISMKIISMIKAGLKGSSELSKFNEVITDAKKLTEQKRYYVSNYGFKNYIDVVNGKTDILIKDENYDKFELENIIAWWKNKASNRYESLSKEKRLRKDLEVWTSGKEIDIIR
jgi:hypothetical protein